MTKQERTVLLAVLVPIIFGAITLIEKGMFILPFPLNEVIFFIAALVFAFQLRKHFVLQIAFSLGFAFFNLLSAEFLWSFLISEQTYLTFLERGTFDLIKLLSLVLLMIWGAISLIRAEDKLRSSIFLVFFALLSASEAFHLPELAIISFLVPFLAGFRYKDLYPYNLLWLLLALLNTMKVIMLAFSIL